MIEGVEAYPLCWPQGWQRNVVRERSRFKVTMGRARDELMREIQRLGGRNPILSTNIPIRKDGLPYSGYAQPKDPAVAVYFTYKGKSMCFACDRWDKIEDNIQSVGKTIEAIRGIERWGASDMLDRAFTGFAALPSPQNEWWHVLGYSSKPHPTPTEYKEAKSKRNALAMKYHPDNGEIKSPEMMSKINQAWEQAEQHFGNAR